MDVLTTITRGKNARTMALPIKLVCAVLATFVLVWCTSIPLGIPGEWTWERRPIASDFWFSLIPAIVWGAIFCAVVWFGSTRIETGSAWQRGSWLAGLFAASFGLIGGLQEAAPPEFRFAKVAFVLYFPGSSGYFTEAKKVVDTRWFLANYELEVNKGDVLHQGTHPPGLIVGYRVLMSLCNNSPALRQVLLATMPSDLNLAFGVIGPMAARTPSPITESDRCVLWLAALLMQACAAATVIPLYFLLRLHADRTTSWFLAALWPTVPAVTVFLPKSDACFPFVGCVVLALWLHGLRKGSLVLAFLAGSVFWLGMTLSLALLPVGFLCAVLTVWYLYGCRVEERWPHSTRRLAWGLVAGLAGFALLSHLLNLTTECNLLNVWGANYRNHAGFYAQFTRTYWKWLLVNPVELCVAAGLPLMVLAATSVPQILKQARTAASGPFWMCLATWTILWLTGKNMGEAARLWIFLMPWIIWSATTGWQAMNTPGSRWSSPCRRWLVCWICQFVTALVIITRVAGFSTYQ